MEADQRTELTKDTRPIEAVYWPVVGAEGHRVGDFGVTKIEPYAEYGEYSMIPWIAVYKGDEIILRVSANQVSINYFEPDANF